MLMKATKQTCAICLYDLGIQSVVLTSIEELGSIRDEYESEPDNIWCDGLGKKYLHGYLKSELQAKDKFFTDHPKLVTQDNIEWVNFCDDCVLLFVLDAYLDDRPMTLMHPDSYAQSLKMAAADSTSGVIPKVIEGIEVLQ